MAIVYCSEKLDGVAAAAIITRHALLRRAKTRFGGYLRHNTLTQQLKELPPEPAFIVGITPNKKDKELIKTKNIIYWSTHDQDAADIDVKIYDRAESRKCSAEMTKERFLPQDSIAIKLAELAHETIFWDKSEESERLSDLIASGYNPTEIINSLARGVMWSPRFEQERKTYLQQKQEAYQKMLNSLTIKRYLRHTFGYAKASKKLSSADACQRVLDVHKGIDVSVAIYRDGTFFFRKRNEVNLDMKQIAEFFDGGGREYASGAHTRQTDFESIMQTIDAKLKQRLIEQ